MASVLNPTKVTVNINRIVKGGKPYLQFDFDGDLKEQNASEAIVEWKTKMPSDGSKINLIYNCLKMTGFETSARREWQTAMKELKNQIDEIWGYL